MPNRIIKESICSSADVDKLTPFEETVFYRLIVNCDDYGRIDARPEFLKSKLFVTKQGITNKNIEDATAKLASVGLVQVYIVAGKPFLSFPTWELHQTIRAKKSKYPAPENICKQMISDASKCSRNPIQSESNTNISVENSQDEFFDADKNVEKGSDKPPNQDKSELDGDALFEKIYGTYPRKTGKSDGKVAFIGYLTTGRRLKGQGTVKLNHVQIGYAIRRYAGEVIEKEEEYIKQFGTFMGSENGKYPIVDYIEASKPEYEAAMIKKYGAEWRKIKYKYKFKGVSEE